MLHFPEQSLSKHALFCINLLTSNHGHYLPSTTYTQPTFLFERIGLTVAANCWMQKRKRMKSIRIMRMLTVMERQNLTDIISRIMTKRIITIRMLMWRTNECSQIRYLFVVKNCYPWHFPASKCHSSLLKIKLSLFEINVIWLNSLLTYISLSLVYLRSKILFIYVDIYVKEYKSYRWLTYSFACSTIEITT